MKLNEKGQCPACKIKPMVYKRDRGEMHPRGKFCHRCCRSFDIETGEQQNNWAWTKRQNGEFAPRGQSQERFDAAMRRPTA